jgi:long-chain acyl-CoA synthetase
VTTGPVAGSVEYWASATPDAFALSDGAQTLSYRTWNEQADRLAELFSVRAGVGAGDHVALCLHNRCEWFVVQAAAAKLEAALVPISFRLTPAEIHYIAADSGARAFVYDLEDDAALARVWRDEPRSERAGSVQLAISIHRSQHADALHFAAVSGGDGPYIPRFAARAPRSIVYTSGTTGRPRGVVHARAATAPRAAAAPTSDRTELQRNLLGAPLNHAAGQASARATHVIGGCVYLMQRFDASQALAIIERERITTSFFVPTMLSRIMSLPEAELARRDVSSIRRLVTGAAPCPQSVKERVIAYFGAHCLVESYGTTEVGLIARMRPEDHLTKPGACGRLLEGVTVEIRDDSGLVLPRGELGEIFVRTPVMIERYLNEAPPRELVNGFFATGDVGRFDDDDYLYVLDRKKDMIIAGGINVYPAEIEDALRRHPAVLDAAAFGIPDADLGEQVKAVVECAEGRQPSEAELLAFVADRLAAYKRPRSIDFMREIPRNPAGKVLKRQLREPYWAATGKHI